MSGKYPPPYGGRDKGCPSYSLDDFGETKNSGRDMSDTTSNSEDRHTYDSSRTGGGRDYMGTDPYQNPESDSESYSAGIDRPAHRNRGLGGRDAYGGRPAANPESDSESFSAGIDRPAHRNRGLGGRDAYGGRLGANPESDSESFRDGMHQPPRHDRYGGGRGGMHQPPRQGDGRNSMGRDPYQNSDPHSEGFSDGLHGVPPGYGSNLGGPGRTSAMALVNTSPDGPRGRTVYSPFQQCYVEVEDSDGDGDTSEVWSDDGSTNSPFGSRGGQGYNNMRPPESTQWPWDSPAYYNFIRLIRPEIVDLSARLNVPESMIREYAMSGHLFRLQGTPGIFMDMVFYDRADDVVRRTADMAGLHFYMPGEHD